MKGGVRATDDITSDLFSATSESKRYIVGPMMEIGLGYGLGVEIDALYRREGYRTAFGNFAGAFFDRERANSWEIPVLLKYKLPVPLAKPYVAVGFAPRTMNGSIDSTGYTIDFQTGQRTFYTLSHANTNWSNSLGVVLGGGIQLGAGALWVSPEVRYTYWNSTPISAFGSQGYGFQSAQNQVDVLIGVSWKIR